jgi:hypothetical protein
MKHPIYLAWVALLAGSLAMANMRGWSFLYSASPRLWMPGLRGSGLSHK